MESLANAFVSRLKHQTTTRTQPDAAALVCFPDTQLHHMAVTLSTLARSHGPESTVLVLLDAFTSPAFRSKEKEDSSKNVRKELALLALLRVVVLCLDSEQQGFEPSTPRGGKTMSDTLARAVFSATVVLFDDACDVFALSDAHKTSLQLEASNVVRLVSSCNFQFTLSVLSEKLRGVKDKGTAAMLAELQALSYVALSADQLGAVLVLSVKSLVDVPEKERLVICRWLTEAIWGFVEGKAAVLTDMYANRARVKGGMGNIIDSLNSWESASKKKAIAHRTLWPLLTMVHVLCCDGMRECLGMEVDRMDAAAHPQWVFIRMLRKALRQSDKEKKEVAISCCCDMLRVAAIVVPHLNKAMAATAVQLLSPLHDQLQQFFFGASLFAHGEPQSSSWTGKKSMSLFERNLVHSFLVSSFALRPQDYHHHVVPMLSNDGIGKDMRLVVVKALLSVSQAPETTHQPFSPSSSSAMHHSSSSSLAWGAQATTAVLPLSYVPSSFLVVERAEDDAVVAMLARPSVRALDYLPRPNSFFRDLRESIAGPLRAMFNTLIDKGKHVAVDKKKGHSQQLLLALGALFIADPCLVMHGKKAQDLASVRTTLQHLTSCAVSCVFPELTRVACEVLQRVHHSLCVAEWAPQSDGSGWDKYFDAIAVVMQGVAGAVMEERVGVEQGTQLLGMLEWCLGGGEFYLQASTRQISDAAKERYTSAFQKVEECALLSLCHFDPERVRLARACISKMIGVHAMIGECPNHGAYMVLCEPGVPFGVMREQHKAIVSMFHAFTQATIGNLGAFAQVYARWVLFTNTLERNDDIHVGSEAMTLKVSAAGRTVSLERDMVQVKNEWHSCTVLLCAMSEAVLLVEDKVHPFPEAAGLDPQQQKAKQDKIRASLCGINAFLSELVGLLTSDTLLVRELVLTTITSALPDAMHASLCNTLVTCLPKDDQATDPRSLLLIERVSMLARLLLKNFASAREIGGEVSVADFEALATRLVDLVDSLGSSHWRLRIKVCELLDYMLQCADSFNFRDRIGFLQHILAKTSEWAPQRAKQSTVPALGTDRRSRRRSGSRLIHHPSQLLPNSPSLANVHNDNEPSDEANDEVELAATVVIMRSLEHLSKEGAQTVIGNSSSMFFYKYTTLLANQLSRSGGQGPPPASVLQLRSLSVRAFAYLINGSKGITIEELHRMGYTPDNEARASYLNILECAVSLLPDAVEEAGEGDTPMARLDALLFGDERDAEGEEQDKEGEAQGKDKDKRGGNEDGGKERKGWMVLVSLLENCRKQELEATTTALMRKLKTTHSELAFVESTIVREVHKSATFQTLFRVNSIATRLMTWITQTSAAEFLKAVLGKLVVELVCDSRELNIDAHNAEGGAEEVAENVAAATELVQKFLDSILSSVPTMPPALRQLCVVLADNVAKKFPDHKLVAVVGFVFLRFFTPAIATPEKYGLLVSDPSAASRKKLLLVAKVLQTLGNQAAHPVGMRPPVPVALSALDAFFTSNIARVVDYLNVLCTPMENADESDVDGEVEMDDASYNDLHVIYRTLSANVSSLDEKIPSSHPASAVWEAVKGVMASVPKSDTPRHRSSATRSMRISGTQSQTKRDLQLLEQFLAQYASLGKSGPELADALRVFFQKGESLRGLPTFYYLARAATKRANWDLMLFHILSLLHPLLSEGKDFEIVLDCTGWDEHHSPPKSFFSRLSSLLPGRLGSLLRGLYLVNVSSFFKHNYLKGVLSFVRRRPWGSKRRDIRVVACAPDELSQFMPEASIGLPLSTLSLTVDVKLRLPVFHESEPGTLLLGANHLILQRKDRVDQLHFSSIDIVPLQSVRDACLCKRSENNDMFVVLLATGSKVFCCNDCTEMIAQLRVAIDANKGEGVDNDVGADNQHDTLGGMCCPLLVMGLVNLTSPRLSTRAAAHSLLYWVCRKFNLVDASQALFRREEHNHAVPVDGSLSTNVASQSSALALPSSPAHFLSSLCTQIHASSPHIANEFWKAVCDAFAHLDSCGIIKMAFGSVHWLPPWFDALGTELDQREKESSSSPHPLVSSLVHLCVRHADVGQAFQLSLWPQLGTRHSLATATTAAVLLVLEQASSGEGDEGPATAKKQGLVDQCARILVAVSTTHEALVGGMLLRRISTLLHFIVASQECSALWERVCALSEVMEMVWFERPVELMPHLADAAYLLLCLYAVTTPTNRPVLYSLLLSLVEVVSVEIRVRHNADKLAPDSPGSHRVLQDVVALVDSRPFRAQFAGQASSSVLSPALSPTPASSALLPPPLAIPPSALMQSATLYHAIHVQGPAHHQGLVVEVETLCVALAKVLDTAAFHASSGALAARWLALTQQTALGKEEGNKGAGTSGPVSVCEPPPKFQHVSACCLVAYGITCPEPQLQTTHVVLAKLVACLEAEGEAAANGKDIGRGSGGSGGSGGAGKHSSGRGFADDKNHGVTFTAALVHALDRMVCPSANQPLPSALPEELPAAAAPGDGGNADPMPAPPSRKRKRLLSVHRGNAPVASVRPLAVWLAVGLVHVSSPLVLRQCLDFMQAVALAPPPVAVGVGAPRPPFSLSRVFSVTDLSPAARAVVAGVVGAMRVDFAAAPGFALASLYVRGLTSAPTRSFALDSVLVFLDKLLQSNAPLDEILPLALVALPFATAVDQESIRTALRERDDDAVHDEPEARGSDAAPQSRESGGWRCVFPPSVARAMLQNKAHHALVFALAEALLSLSQTRQQVVVYSVVRELVQAMPDELGLMAKALCERFVQQKAEPDQEALAVVLSTMTLVPTPLHPVLALEPEGGEEDDDDDERGGAGEQAAQEWEGLRSVVPFEQWVGSPERRECVAALGSLVCCVTGS